MMNKFHELLKEVDIHKNQMVENQTDFPTATCFLVDIQIYYSIEFFQKHHLIRQQRNCSVIFNCSVTFLCTVTMLDFFHESGNIPVSMLFL